MSEPHVSRKTFNPGRMMSGMGLIGAILLAITLFMMIGETTRQGMLQSYLWAWVFWGGLTFGCFGMTLLHHSLKGAWGTSVMRIWEAGGGVANLLAFGLLFS